MPKIIKLTKEQLRDSIEKNHGMMQYIIRELQVDRATAKKYIEKYGLTDFFQEQREKILDMTEMAIFKKIEEGHPQSLMFILRTIGKHRGYQENLKIDSTAETKVENLIKNIDDKFWESERDRGTSE